jgi:hypothetical protein
MPRNEGGTMMRFLNRFYGEAAFIATLLAAVLALA